MYELNKALLEGVAGGCGCGCAHKQYSCSCGEDHKFAKCAGHDEMGDVIALPVLDDVALED